MKKKILLVCVFFLSLYSVWAQTLPITSTNSNEVWYYIECMPRSTNSEAKWLTGCASGGVDVITTAVLDKTDDTQLWKIVENAGGLALVNKKFNNYIDADKRYDAVATSIIPCVAAAPSTGLKLVPYVDQNARPDGFYLVNSDAVDVTNAANASVTFQFYSAGAGSQYRPINYGPNGANINSTLVFRTPKSVLFDILSRANVVLKTCSAGSEPGQFPFESMEALNSIIESSQGIYDNSASASIELMNAASELKSTLDVFSTTVNQPQLSKDGNEYWYYIQGTRKSNTYLTAGPVGAGESVKNLSIIPDDTQLWKLVSNTNGTANGFALVNKATGEYINTDTQRVIATQTDMPTNNLVLIPHTTYINKRLLFRIENAVGSTPALRFHFDGDSGVDLVNWTGNANVTSDWLFLSVDEAAKVQFSAAVTAARQKYDASASKEGEEFGQYPAATRAAFLTVLSAMEKKDVSAMTQDELTASLGELNAALEAFTFNSDASFLVSTTEKTKYFNIKVIQSNKYIKDAGMDAKICQTPSLTAGNDSLLWRIEETAPGAGTYNVISKLGHKMYWDANEERYFAGAAGVAFTIGFQSQGVVVLGRDGSGQYFNCWAGDVKGESGATQVGEYDAFGDAFNLLDFTYVGSVNTSVQSISSTISIKTIDRKIVVSGTNTPIQAFTVSGIQVNPSKSLIPGIYIVRVDGQTFKVAVQ